MEGQSYAHMTDAVILAKSMFQDAAEYLGVDPAFYFMTAPDPKVYRDNPYLPGRVFVFVPRVRTLPDIRVYVRQAFRKRGAYWTAEKVIVGNPSPLKEYAVLVLRDRTKVPIFRGIDMPR